jgi:hypothetical protein
MSLHAFDENCKNLILFEFLIFSQGVRFGFVASDIHVAKSLFSSFDFWTNLGWMAGASFLVGLIRTILSSYQNMFILTMSFQWFFKTLNNFLHDSNPSLSTQETKLLPPPSQKTINLKHLCRY